MAEINKDTLKELVAMGRSSVSVQTPAVGAVPFAVIPSDCKIEDLSRLIYNEHTERPERIKQTIKVFDTGSFCEYFTAFSDPNSRVFADETANKVLAIIDYHSSADGGVPRWGHHRVELGLRHSQEWQAWTVGDGKKLTQIDFAELIEDNAPDITNPAAATMLDVAKSLTAKSEVDFASAIRLSNGSVQFKFTEQVKGTYGAGNLDVPEQFVISIPIYIGMDRVAITARLRYRINAGKLTFWYDLLRLESIKRDAFLAVRATIEDSLKVRVINGSPC